MNKDLHRQIYIKGESIAEEIKLAIGNNERLININMYINLEDEFDIYMISPSKLKTNIISSKSKIIKNIINNTKIKAYTNKINPKLSKKVVEINMNSEFFIESGIWKIVIIPIKVSSKIIDIDIVLPRITSKETKFLDFNEDMTNEYRTIDYKNDCMGYGHLKLEDINFRDLTTKNNQKNRADKNVYNSNSRNYLNPNDVINNTLDGFTPKFAIRYDSEFKENFNKLGELYKFLDFGGNLGIIFVKQDSKADTNKNIGVKGILRLEEIANLAILGNVREGKIGGVSAIAEIGANFIKNNPNTFITGRGVLIGIIDTGIDYLHKDFIYPDGTSKIVYLWDQTKDGRHPNEYLIGSEFTREDINEAIKNNDPSLSQDEVGHGTMISGICAGLGSVEREYAGIAEDSELIVVKLAKVNGNYNNISLIAAIQYIYEKSIQLNSPVVINISFGSNFSIGLNSRLIFNDHIFPYLTRGFLLVAGAGNEGNTATHAMGKLKYTGETVDVEIEVSDKERDLEIQILASKPDKIMVSIISPSGEGTKLKDVASYGEVAGIFDLERSRYKITYIYPTAYSGQQESRVRITNIKKGIWKIRLFGEYIIDGVYHIFLPNRVFLNDSTRFRSPNPDYTINYPAELKEILAIGAYDTRNNGIWSTSSRGPAISGYSKPLIVAPGVNIIGPYPGNEYGVVTGTAAAAAHVTGALALYLQYTLVDKTYPNRAFMQQVKTYLKAGADRSQERMYPNNEYGYGLLNIRGIFEQLK